jgi:hypothetical protein
MRQAILLTRAAVLQCPDQQVLDRSLTGNAARGADDVAARHGVALAEQGSKSGNGFLRECLKDISRRKKVARPALLPAPTSFDHRQGQLLQRPSNRFRFPVAECPRRGATRCRRIMDPLLTA